MSVKRRLGVGAGSGSESESGCLFFFLFVLFFAIYLQIDSFWSKKYLLVYNEKSFSTVNKL